MKKTKLTRSLLAACSIVALSVVLSGCLHSGGDDTEEMDTGGMDMPPPPPPPANLTTNFADAQDAIDDAAEADELAHEAEEAVGAEAGNVSSLTTMGAAGDSSVAMAAAEAILKAQTDAGDAVTNAQKALDDANEAKTEAEAIADDHPQKAALLKAIDAAIEAAEGALEDATAIRDGDAIKMAVAAVTGGEDADPQGTPLSIANVVGMDIAAALQPASATDGGGLRHTHGQTAPTDTTDPLMSRVVMNDRVGMKWADIAGVDRMERVGTENTVASLGSVAGMTAADIDTDVTATGGVDSGNTYADGFSSTGSTYKGIGGSIFCLGTDCEVDADGNLAGSWYFTPTDPDAYWVKDAAGTGYTTDTMFATFGHWLTVADQGNTDPSDDLWTVNTFATSGISERGDLTTVNTTTLADTSATYSGSAAGMSVRKMTNAAGDGQDIDSGRFTADVSLTAEFGTGPMLSGHIDNFQGSAVGNWRVTLERRAFDANFTDDSGVASSSGRDGEWNASAYGVAGARPTGIYGSFNAHFLDGHAAGAYSTRMKDE